jgi:hypothetical protein
MARFTLTGLPVGLYRVRVGSIVHYVEADKYASKPDITCEPITDRGRTSLRPYVTGPNRQYKTLAAAVAALIKERT